MEFAVKKGVSLSTLRRHIKANKIPYRVENGRYLLLDNEGFEEQTPVVSHDDGRSPHLQSRLQQMENQLKQAQEEIAELKMLIALYEEKIAPPIQTLDN